MNGRECPGGGQPADEREFATGVCSVCRRVVAITSTGLAIRHRILDDDGGA